VELLPTRSSSNVAWLASAEATGAIHDSGLVFLRLLRALRKRDRFGREAQLNTSVATF
jgi:hypothetical protein